MSIEQDINDLIDEVVALEAFETNAAAKDILNQLAENDPAALAEWQEKLAFEAVKSRLQTRVRSARAHRRQELRRQKLDEMVDQAIEEGSTRIFAQLYCLGDGTTKQLGEMTGVECRKAAIGFEQTARTSALEAEFLRQVAKRAGGQKVSEVFEEEILDKLYRSILVG